MGEQSETIFALRPVSFRYKRDLNPSGDAQFGLVGLEVCDEQGNPLSVRY